MDDMKVLCLQGGGATSLSVFGVNEDVCYTLNCTDVHGVVYAKEVPEDDFPVESVGHDIRSTQFSKMGCCDTLTSSDYKQPIVVAYEQKDNDVIVLNDQGGSQMSVDNVSATLRAETHGHPPIIVFKERAGKAGGGRES